MTQDEIIEMARQAGFLYGKMGPLDMPFVAAIGHTFIVELEAFAKLVAAKEREACINICENFADVDSGPDGIIQDYHAYLIRARNKL